MLRTIDISLTASTQGDEAAKLEETAVSMRKEGVRVATIDNYQGEESDIVIASLVRSNPEGQIGFLSGAERVNVLLSRARLGMILIGNSHTLTHAKSGPGRELWKGILSLMDVQEGLPVCCVNHGTKKLLKTRADFTTHAIDGGCDLPCGQVLPSCPLDHKCQMRCHPGTHEGIKCTVTLDAECVKGHPVKRACCNEAPDLCHVSVRDMCPSGHSNERLCFQPLTSKCPPCDRKKVKARDLIFKCADGKAGVMNRANSVLCDVHAGEANDGRTASSGDHQRGVSEARSRREETGICRFSFTKSLPCPEILDGSRSCE